MRRSILLLCLTLFGAGCAYAQDKPKVQLDITTGYERQNLDWSIAGNQSGQNPNIYSELKWKNVGGQMVSGVAQWNIWGNINFIGSYSRTFITSGMVTDNDYNGDNRTNEVYNETFDADKGHTQAWHIGAGYNIINSNRFSLTPYVGYGISRQSLHLLDRTGNFPDLNSTYQTDWKGPFVKAVAALKFANKFNVKVNLTYNQVNYNAVADWNFIQTFQHPVSYRHTAKGFGLDANAALAYNITQNIAIQAGAGYFKWQTGKGIDELYLQTGGSEKTQLNGVDGNGYRIFGGLVFKY